MVIGGTQASQSAKSACLSWRRRLAGDFSPSAQRKDAGETPAPQQIARAELIAWISDRSADVRKSRR
jgi:hypothetical protein